MADYDNPTRKEGTMKVQHWVVVNIPGNKISEGEVKT
jgi:phosphatidylethanolamine-binding protein (PEBP) family uncharacterized protein